MRTSSLFLKSVLVMFMLLMCRPAHADLNYETAYMVTDNNSHTLSLDSAGDYSYTPDQTPWVYIKFKYDALATLSPLHMLWVWSSFTDPQVTHSQLSSLNISSLSTDEELWSSAPQPWWSANGGIGQWHVDINWFNVHGTNGISSADFSVACKDNSGGGIIPFSNLNGCGPVVTPEPVSSTLFLLGGIPLAMQLRRKKQKSA